MLLPSALNFRDLGGIATRDGQTIRYGHIFRSGRMHQVTDTDINSLKTLAPKALCDLRSGWERLKHPDHWASQFAIDHWFYEDMNIIGSPDQLTKLPLLTANQAYRMMCDGYQKLPFEQTAGIGEVFNRLIANQTPLIFHCSAGKDRTGIYAALILEILGVARDNTLHEYQLSNHCLDNIHEIVLEQFQDNKYPNAHPEVWLTIARANPDFLQAMFKGIEETHGTVAQYLKSEIGLTEDNFDILRKNLLE